MLALLMFFVPACAGNDNGMFDETKDPTVDSVQPDDDGKETEPENQEKEPEIQEREPELEHGFFEPKPEGYVESPPYNLAYRSYTNKFDVNNVTLRLYYGYMFFGDAEDARKNHRLNCPEFEISCYNYDICNKSQSNYHILKKVSENIISDKYRIIRENRDEGTYFIFNYSEEFTIPADVFSEEYGQLYIEIGGVNLKRYGGPEYEVIDVEVLNYELTDSKVKLTPCA